MSQNVELSPATRMLIRAVDALVAQLARHWLLYFNLILLVFAGLPVLAPVLFHLGLEFPARVIYTAYSFTCHQLAYRSWFLFGQQSSYTVEQLQQYLHVQNPALDLFFWRNWLGNEQLGYKMAFCERDAAIYTSMLLAGMLYGLIRPRVKALDWRWFVLLAVVPMLADGGTQLLMLRESTPLLRAVTGVLLGTLAVWLVYPEVDKAMRETYSQTEEQALRLRERERAGG